MSIHQELTAEQLTQAALSDPELREQLFNDYGVVIAASPTGEGYTLAEVRTPGKLRKALAEGLVEGRETGTKVGHKVAAGASKTAEVVSYAVLAAPKERVRQAKAERPAKKAERQLKREAKHAERVALAKQRHQARAEAKAAKAQAKAQPEQPEA